MSKLPNESQIKSELGQELTGMFLSIQLKEVEAIKEVLFPP